MAFALTPEREQKVDDILTRYPERRAALLPVLWLCQRQNGWISPEVVEYVAARLELSTSIVKGVVTFYTMFFDEPVGENVVWVCRTLSCDLRGGKAIQDHLETKLGCTAGHTSSDGKFTLLKAECLAACGQAPMVQINDHYYENLDVELLDRIIDTHAAKGGEAAAAEFATFASFPPRSSGNGASGAAVSSAPPPPSREAVRLASQPPPPADEKGDDS
ncbi:MAG: NAD(P)H-dependent oxidoreductase subunit E [Deltaproteobacteria bacterium]|nr:NAD(P)H-dependent oxidoreductase subunit E [Deltaproteobacteria bacterium]NND27760.1 NAD(P)H-dependent oxidoreductase subunit E [Myxococcales bacterium]MBT8466150.1 NAD(P)H-dependent oxidoreductase subunit E [Deltaproteobacteria bacterium]MBT8482160.1 NAD(P)H-dependent oxidoreductase subunit E [Deltaproteobacteria bacterium]NNK07097.1 NAD(P)H-dependent oxidoreductase subunit E [Myxococcales bacterium]